jgi:hypothetical protein
MSTDLMNAEEAVLNMLNRYEVLTMEDLILGRPDFSWAQLFLAVDRLSRTNMIALSRFGLGYQLRLIADATRLGRPLGHVAAAARLVSDEDAWRADVSV